MMFLCLVSASLCFVRSHCVQPVYLGAATRTMSEDIVMVWYGMVWSWDGRTLSHILLKFVSKNLVIEIYD